MPSEWLGCGGLDCPGCPTPEVWEHDMTVYSSIAKTTIKYSTLRCTLCGWHGNEDGKQHGLLILRPDVSLISLYPIAMPE